MILADALVDAFLAEDVPFGDLTSAVLGIGDAPALIRLRRGRPPSSAASRRQSG
ncbi:MAG: hypothetical protein U1E35_06680 [Rhodospirillales bacterium]